MKRGGIIGYGIYILVCYTHLPPGEVIGKEQKMKKRYLILILIFFNIYT